jgi:predicted transcriptional regulator
MTHCTTRLADLRVEDAMAREVIAVSVHSTMSEAADVLMEAGISGAPVVDHEGRCVGVLTGCDYVRERAAAHDEDGGAISLRGDAGGFRVWIEDQDLVRRRMSTGVQTIDRRRSLLDAARFMCGQHVHRLIVVDANHRPVGLISSLDLVAAVLNVAQEEEPGL